MSDYSFNIEIPEETVQKIVSNVESSISDKISDLVRDEMDYDYIASEVQSLINADDLLSEVSSYTWTDIVSENIDYDNVADIVCDKIDMSSDIRAETNDVVESLLGDYDPHTSCITGKLFTEAIYKAIDYLIQEERLSFIVNDKVEEPQEPEIVEQKEESEDFTPLFNPDLVGVYAVVAEMYKKYGASEFSDAYISDLQMRMWQVFVNARDTYNKSFNRSES